MRTWHYVAIIVALIAVSVALQVKRDRGWQAYDPKTPIIWLQAGPAVERAMLGYDAIASDAYWIRTVVYFGRQRFVVLRPAAGRRGEHAGLWIERREGHHRHAADSGLAPGGPVTEGCEYRAAPQRRARKAPFLRESASGSPGSYRPEKSCALRSPRDSTRRWKEGGYPACLLPL